MRAMIGQKLGMSRIFDEQGKVVPVTLVLAKDNIVTQIKTAATDGYDGVQITLPDNRKIKKPQAGHLAKVKVKSRYLKEFPLAAENELKVGDSVDLSQFKINDKVNVSAISKGKGFAGTVKRHHFHLGPKTHGSDNYRRPGSIGATYPQRVIKGRRMAGHLGAKRATTKNLKIVHIDSENKVLMLAGAVPGANKSIVYIWSNQ